MLCTFFQDFLHSLMKIDSVLTFFFFFKFRVTGPWDEACGEALAIYQCWD